MSISREDLLRPSLVQLGQPAAAPYSVQAGFVVAFFGGPFAAALMLLINAHRTRRLLRDLVWVLLIAGAFTAWLAFMHQTADGQAVQARLESALGRGATAMVGRLLGLLAFVLGMLLHRREQRGADLFGLSRPNGWVVGIGLVVLGPLLTAAVTAALK